MSVDPSTVTEWANASKSALELLRAALPFLPKEQRENAEAKMQEAQSALSRADAQLAQKLGYPLCKCTFPPSIMLTKPAEQLIYCTSCGHSVSTKPQDPEEASWIRARNGDYF